MCVAIPGKVIKIHENKGIVSYGHNHIDVDLSLVTVQIGDYVLVHAGCAIERLEKSQAEEILSLFAELEEVLKS